MPSVEIHTILGPLPLLRGLFRWSLAVIFAVGAWHLYLWSPLPGLVAIGITPVLAIFFFFRGLNLVSRTLPYCAEEIREAAKIFQNAYATQEKGDLPVTFADLREKENKASEAH